MKETNQNNATNVTEETKVQTTYTEDQVREIYAEAQKAGYIAAVRQMRSDVLDYLNDLLISVETSNK